MCANVKMETVIFGYSIAVYGCLSFTNGILVSLMSAAGACFIYISTSSSILLLGALWTESAKESITDVYW